MQRVCTTVVISCSEVFTQFRYMSLYIVCLFPLAFCVGNNPIIVLEHATGSCHVLFGLVSVARFNFVLPYELALKDGRDVTILYIYIVCFLALCTRPVRLFLRVSQSSSQM